MKRWSELVPLAILNRGLDRPAVLLAGRPQRDRLARPEDDPRLDLADVVAPPAAAPVAGKFALAGSRASVRAPELPQNHLQSKNARRRVVARAGHAGEVSDVCRIRDVVDAQATPDLVDEVEVLASDFARDPEDLAVGGHLLVLELDVEGLDADHPRVLGFCLDVEDVEAFVLVT